MSPLPAMRGEVGLRSNPGEGHGTESQYAQNSRIAAPHPNPLPAKAGRGGGATSQPGHRLFRLGLVAGDRLALLHGQPDVVEAVEHAVLAVRVDVELDHAAVGAADFLLFE